MNVVQSGSTSGGPKVKPCSDRRQQVITAGAEIADQHVEAFSVTQGYLEAI